MKVRINYDDGEYFFRQFKPGHMKESYAPPEDVKGAIEVPDHVVEHYATLRADWATMQTLIAFIEDQEDRRSQKEETP